MGNVLVFVERLDGAVASVSREALTAARQFAAGAGCKVEALALRGEPAEPVEAPTPTVCFEPSRAGGALSRSRAAGPE